MLPLLLLSSSLAVVSAAWWLLVCRRHPRDFPPGPRMPVPFLGDTWAMGGDLPKGFTKMAEKWVD